MGIFTPKIVDFANELKYEARKFVIAKKRGQVKYAIELEKKMRYHRNLLDKAKDPNQKKKIENYVKEIEKQYNKVLDAQTNAAKAKERIKDLIYRIGIELT